MTARTCTEALRDNYGTLSTNYSEKKLNARYTAG